MKFYVYHLPVKTLALYSFICLFLACNNQQSTIAEAETGKSTATKELVLDKLPGTWQSEDGKTFERWTKQENGTFQSVVFSLKGTDTIYKEQAIVYLENDQWVFENNVKDQNEGKSVKFLASSVTATQIQFSNPAHDFPTDINYSVPDAYTVRAFIIGPNSKGGKDTIPFNYKRVK